MVKNKLKNLVVPEVSTEPGLREMETGNYKELAEDEETFIDELEVLSNEKLRRPVTRLTIQSVKRLSLKTKTV